MLQYAYTGKGKPIHSCGQLLEWYKNDVNYKLIKVPGGLQRIQTNDGHAIPINVKEGLPYVQMEPYTDEEWDTFLPHVILTSDVDWDPTVLDHTLDDDDEWFDAVSDLQNDPTTNLFDEFGNYRKCTVVVEENDTFFDTITVVNKVAPEMPSIDSIIDDCILYRNLGLYEAPAREVETKEPEPFVHFSAGILSMLSKGHLLLQHSMPGSR
jgi:hypothetical protein